MSETPQAITGGVLNQMIKIKGKNLSHVKSISFNGLEVDVRHAAYAERDFCNVTIPRKIPKEVTNKLVYTTEQGIVTVDFPVNIPNLQLDGLKNEFTLQGDKVQVMGDYFDLYGFSKDEELNTATITIHNDDLGYSEVIPTDSITETYMGILIPKDAPDNSLITFEWDGMDGRKTKTIPYRMSDQLMFSNMDGDLGLDELDFVVKKLALIHRYLHAVGGFQLPQIVYSIAHFGIKCNSQFAQNFGGKIVENVS